MLMPMTRTDEERYRAFRDRNDETALDELLARHFQTSYRLALAIVGDPGAAEDAAQLAFVRVVEAARRRKTLDPFEGWLRTVVVNEARHQLRARKTHARHEEAAMKAESTSPEEDPVAAIREHAGMLPRELREPLVLHFGLGLTHAEVGEALSIPRRTITKRLEEATSRLRETLTASGVASVVVLDEAIRDGLDLRSARASRVPAARSIVTRASQGGSSTSLLSPARLILPSVVALAVVAAVAFAPRSADNPVSSSPAVAPETSRVAAEGKDDARAPDPSPPRGGEVAPAETATKATRPRNASRSAGTTREVAFVVKGRVLDGGGKPEPSARVRLLARVLPGDLPATTPGAPLPRKGEHPLSLAARAAIDDPEYSVLALGQDAITDAEGRFTIDVSSIPLDEVEPCLVACSADEKRCAILGSDDSLQPSPGATLTTRDVVLDRAPSVVSISVHAGSLALDGAELMIEQGWRFDSSLFKDRSWRAGLYPHDAATDAAGAFDFVTTACDIVVRVMKAGYETQTRKLYLDGGEVKLDCDLAPSAPVSGTVRDASGRPVAGAKLVLLEWPGHVVHPVKRGWATADHLGHYRIDGGKKGDRYLVVASPPEGREAELGMCQLAALAPRDDLDVVLDRPVVITVLPRFEEKAKKSVYARLAKFFLEELQDGVWVPVVEAYGTSLLEPDGDGKVEGLGPGTYRAGGDASDYFAPYVSDPVEVAPGDSPSIEVVVGGRMRYAVLKLRDSSGTPRDDATFEADDPHLPLESLGHEGSYTLRLPEGPVSVRVSAPGCTPTKLTLEDDAEIVLDREK